MKKKRPAAESATAGLEDLLGDGPEEQELSVSQKYAKTFNEKMDKIEAARAAKILEDEDLASNSSDETTEDENAELLTGRVESKIFETLSKIKAKDPSIYDSKTTFFNDDDFKAESAKDAAKKESTEKMTYKNFIRKTLMQEGADAIAREEDEIETKRKRRKTPAEEQRDLQAEIRAAAHSTEADDQDLFSIKEQTLEEKEQQDEDFARFQAKTERRADNADSVMSNYWRADEDLDEDERFLRDYVMNRQWLETDSLQAPKKEADTFDLDEDDEDDEDVEEAEEFEKDYNFRFEVEEGRQIQGHARFPENSVRERNDKRKRQRKEKAERKDAEKIRRTEELKRLKNLKKQEIQRRLEQIREITGNEDTGLETGDLDTEFDPKKHDETMATILGEDYDEKEEVLTEKELLGGDGHAELDTSKEAMGGLQKHWGVNAQDEWQEDGQENEVEDADAEAEEEEHPELWFLCDGCKAPIPAGKRRFDCTVCENFTLCMKCFRVRRHPHKFVRRRVPESCTPPEDFKGMQIGTDGETNKSLDEYFQLDYEDIIGGDLPTRFKYRSVKPNDYGIPANVILSKSSKELNQMVSIKKLRPYRDEEEPESSQSKRNFGKGKGDSKGSGKGKSKGKSKGSSKGSSKEKETSQDEQLSSSRFKAYNLEGDKFAGVKVKDWSKSKKGPKTKSSASKS